MCPAVILLVEDDIDVREMLEMTLAVSGHAVTVATNGAAALEAIERGRPCLVILDLVMPVLDGWGVIAQMKERNLDDVPVCVISAFGERAPDEAIATLCKPFDTNQLLAIADRYCAHPAR